MEPVTINFRLRPSEEGIIILPLCITKSMMGLNKNKTFVGIFVLIDNESGKTMGEKMSVLVHAVET
jgi:hypothetical protein